MDIEELVQKYYAHWNSHSMTMCQALESALTELAAGYEQQITELQAMAINNGQQAVLLGERVKQLEAERVPDKKPLPTLMMASYHEAIGWNSCVDAMLAVAPQPKKERE